MGAIRFQDITPTQVEALKAVKVCPEVQKHFDVSQRIPQPFMDSVEVYDPDLDRWSEVTPLCCARMAANAVEFRGQMYVVGGLMMVAGQKRKVCIVPDTMCFNPMDDTPRGRRVSNPWRPSADVLEYSLANDSWSRISIMPVSAHSVGLASLGEDIYILCGELADDAAAATRNAYRYNPVTYRWVRCHHCRCALARRVPSAFGNRRSNDARVEVYASSNCLPPNI
ncbi:hypothetical protein MTO96_010026 [Rhipicephalus appendiculatus]